jgi:pyruvate,water dikinase
MRGLAEIDLGRPRWREQPAPIISSLQSYLRIDDPGQAPDAVFRRSAGEAEKTAAGLARAARRSFVAGRLKARLVEALARRVRLMAGYREMPKFIIIRLFGVGRAALLDSGQALVERGTLRRADDLFFLRWAELRALAAGEERPWGELVAKRRERYRRETQRVQIPRLLLSNGRAFYEGIRRDNDAPPGDENILVGSPVSPGVVEGVVHVVFNPHDSQLAPGEILVCPGTDPAWTPLFLSAGGLVMEMGGLMTHGSVVAREYGIPAVVGVHEATKRLQSGQRIRVDGGAGAVEILNGKKADVN